MEHQLNSIVQIEDNTYKVELGNVCNICAFYNENIVERCKVCANLDCSQFNRSDKTDIIYKNYEEN